eukprot:CAMPEP_0113489106 /NCGR_PEP_ID=MMETSP0014_2-20120614/26360_1 /TAXON_ID=2857 /ORGANISM="Nitzschia sp." /LENGTH=713 /DNA_ID=CAMNT_0000382837 /DNA_START=182 /DNA_END=2319 /DNA_ORIENTATION=- /assembly_acc=CAM_ASM_000159
MATLAISRRRRRTMNVTSTMVTIGGNSAITFLLLMVLLAVQKISGEKTTTTTLVSDVAAAPTAATAVIFVDTPCHVFDGSRGGTFVDDEEEETGININSNSNSNNKNNNNNEDDESLLVRYENILVGEGIWIGLYREQDLLDVLNSTSNTTTTTTSDTKENRLPDRLPPVSRLVAWEFICRQEDNCNEAVAGRSSSSSGDAILDLSTVKKIMDLRNEKLQRYVVVVSANHGDTSQPPQATTTIEIVQAIDDCSSTATATTTDTEGETTSIVGSLIVPTLPPSPAADETAPNPVPTINLPPVFNVPSHSIMDVPSHSIMDVLEKEEEPVDQTSHGVPFVDQPPARIVPDQQQVRKLINDAKNWISELITQDGDNMGLFLRLVFHDCVGGCDGCIDMTNPDNNGLSDVMDTLQPIVDHFDELREQQQQQQNGATAGLLHLTRTDIWMLSGLVASEHALPEDMRGMITFPLHWIGRRTCEMSQPKEEDIDTLATTTTVEGGCGVDFFDQPSSCTMRQGGHRHLCHSEAGTKTVQDFFDETFGFDAQQVTAIMGAHSLGKMRREVSGHKDLSWDLSPFTLDNGYWIELAGNPPDYQLVDVDNTDLPPESKIPSIRRQWFGVVRGSPVGFMNSDLALGVNLPDLSEENGHDVGCDFISGSAPTVDRFRAQVEHIPNACQRDTPFLEHIFRYLSDTELFLLEYRDVLNLLIDFGHHKVP